MGSWIGCAVAHGSLMGQRDTYEDRSLAMRLSPGSSLWGFQAVVAVADGMGGHNAGDVAAQTAIDTLREITAAQRGQTVPLDQSIIRAGGGAALAEALNVASSNIFSRAAESEALQQMGTTATVAAIESDRMIIAHVGDSRAYSIRQGGVEQLTTDHSWVGEQVEAGTMTAEEARRSPLRNQITRTVGTRESVEPDVFEVKLQGDEVVLICSDGLVECLNDDTIGELVRSAESIEAAVQRLLNAAQQTGPQDNVTVAAVEIGMFFALYGGLKVNDSGTRRGATPSGSQSGRSFYRPTLLALAVVAAFAFGAVVRLGWAALFPGGPREEEPRLEADLAPVEEQGVPATPQNAEEALEEASNSSPEGSRIELVVEEPDFLLTIQGVGLEFAHVRARDSFVAVLEGADTIRYTFKQWEPSGRMMEEDEAWVIIDGPRPDGQPIELRKGDSALQLDVGSYTCLFQTQERQSREGKEPFALFDFDVTTASSRTADLDHLPAGHP